MAHEIDEEGSKGGRRSVTVFAIVAATLTVLLFLIGTRHITGTKVAAPPQPTAETPAPQATTETPAPQPNTEAPAKTNP